MYLGRFGIDAARGCLISLRPYFPFSLFDRLVGGRKRVALDIAFSLCCFDVPSRTGNNVPGPPVGILQEGGDRSEARGMTAFAIRFFAFHLFSRPAPVRFVLFLSISIATRALARVDWFAREGRNVLMTFPQLLSRALNRKLSGLGTS